MSDGIFHNNNSNQSSLILAGIGWLIFSLMSFYFGRRGVGFIELVFSIINFLLVIDFRNEKNVERKVHFSLFIAVFGIFVITNINGQFRTSPIVWFYAMVPLIAAIRLSVKDGIAWALVTATFGLLNFLLPPLFPVDRFSFNAIEYYIGFIVFFAIITLIAASFRRENDAIIERLKSRESELELIAETLVEQKTELKRTRDEALEATNVKSLFLANMSHEIRTPLNGVIGMSSVLLGTELTNEQRSFAKVISKSGSALLSVINEVLDFSKLEAGLVQVERLPFDLYECVDDVLDIFGHEVETKQIDLAARISKKVPRTVKGDLTRVRQILVNLVGNAIKFTEEGEVVLQISMTEKGIQFDVKDTGIGVPPDQYERLFKDFSQIDASTTRRFGGTGLGLAISRRLVEFMDGQIWFTSKVGEGSCFSFFLPLAEVASPMRRTVERISLLGRSCVVIGEEKASREAMVDRLEMWGMSVETLADFSQVIRRLGEPELFPDIVILNDKEDREHILNTLRKTDEGIRTIIVLSLSSDLDQKGLDALQINAAIYRPIRFKQLRQILESIVGGWSPETTASLSLFDSDMASKIPLRLLVAEDNETNRHVALAMFRRLGYQVQAVENGAEVLEILENENFDIIFMDIQMPILDGIETTKKIREIYTDKPPWIVALSASVLDTQRIEARDAGMDDFLGKPYEVSNLVHVIERFITNERPSFSKPYNPVNRALSTDRNPKALASLRELFPEKIKKFHNLIQQHIGNADILVAKIKDAVELENYDDLKIASHSLKSSAAMFGSRRVSEICHEIERNAIDQTPFDPDLFEYSKQLRIAWKRAKTYFNALIISELSEVSDSEIVNEESE